MVRNLGPFIVLTGIVIVVVGILVWVGGLSWFGRLPGDIRIERGNLRIYIPVASMLLISVTASVLLFIWRLLIRR